MRSRAVDPERASDGPANSRDFADPGAIGEVGNTVRSPTGIELRRPPRLRGGCPHRIMADAAEVETACRSLLNQRSEVRFDVRGCRPCCVGADRILDQRIAAKAEHVAKNQQTIRQRIRPAIVVDVELRDQ